MMTSSGQSSVCGKEFLRFDDIFGDHLELDPTWLLPSACPFVNIFEIGKLDKLFAFVYWFHSCSLQDKCTLCYLIKYSLLTLPKIVNETTIFTCLEWYVWRKLYMLHMMQRRNGNQRLYHHKPGRDVLAKSRGLY